MSIILYLLQLPAFATLRLLLLQLKVNASSVPSTLCGDQHGYVGAILSPVTYVTIVPIQPFIPLIHPGILQIVHPATRYEIALAKTLHNKGVQTFQSYQLIQRELAQQVFDDVEDKHLSCLRNSITG